MLLVWRVLTRDHNDSTCGHEHRNYEGAAKCFASLKGARAIRLDYYPCKSRTPLGTPPTSRIPEDTNCSEWQVSINDEVGNYLGPWTLLTMCGTEEEAKSLARRLAGSMDVRDGSGCAVMVSEKGRCPSWGATMEWEGHMGWTPTLKFPIEREQEA